MTPFEQELKKALHRRQPSDDFAERLLRKVSEPPMAASKPSVAWLWPAPLFRLAAGIAMLVLLVSGMAYQRHVHVQEGQAAKQRLLVALRIAGSELRETQTRVWHVENSQMVVIE